MINLAKFGQFVTIERTSRNMTQKQLSEILYVTPQAISKWERGVSFPDIETLVLLCYEYNISIDFLLSECFESLDSFDDICKENIGQYLHSTHRKEILEKIISNELNPITLTSIFYLLNIQERLKIIERIIAKDITINLCDFLILLNAAERIKLLDGIHVNTQQSIYEITYLLSPLEKKKYNVN